MIDRPHRDPRLRPRSVALVGTLVLVVALSACGSSAGSDAAATTAPPTTAAPTTEAPTTAAPAHPLRVLVTNDDGVGADGIDAVVNALSALPDTTVTVVAPLTNQSGTGGNTTAGALTVADAKTKSGYAAKAVTGFPADTIRVAIDEEHLEVDLVVSGINLGQNLGPNVDLSGTVGAARAAAAHGIPALAASQGVGKAGLDWASGAKYVLMWVADHRAALLAGTAPKVVANMNIPSCAGGSIRGELEVAAPPLPIEGALALQDCSATGSDYTTDVTAFNDGYVTLTEPLRPKA